MFISNTLRIWVCISVNWWHVLWLRYQTMETHFLAILCKKHSDESGIESVCIDAATDSVTTVTFRTKLLTDEVAVVQPVDRRDGVNDLQLEWFMERRNWIKKMSPGHQQKKKWTKTHFVKNNNYLLKYLKYFYTRKRQQIERTKNSQSELTFHHRHGKLLNVEASQADGQVCNTGEPAQQQLSLSLQYP